MARRSSDRWARVRDLWSVEDPRPRKPLGRSSFTSAFFFVLGPPLLAVIGLRSLVGLDGGGIGPRLAGLGAVLLALACWHLERRYLRRPVAGSGDLPAARGRD